MKEIKYIGLDISTSIIGICFMDINDNLVLLDSINLKKEKCLFKKAEVFKKYIEDNASKYQYNSNIIVAIEESFQSFSKGFSSANTLSKLNRFNGIISYIMFSIIESVPCYINVNSARKSLQIKLNKKLEESTKEQVFKWVRDDFDLNNIKIIWPEKTISRGKNKGLVKFDESCYDMSDAYVICKAAIFNERNTN